MKKKIGYKNNNYFSNKMNLFEYPTTNKRLTAINADKWPKIEYNKPKNHNDTLSSLNLGSLKSLDWDEIQEISPKRKEIKFDSTSNQKSTQKIFIDVKRLDTLVHPVDTSFEKFIQKKIINLDEIKNKYKSNKKKKNIDIINIINTNTSNNNMILTPEKKEEKEKSIIKEKNEAIFTFNKNDFDNNIVDEYEKMKSKSIFFESIYNNNTSNTNNNNGNSIYDNNLGKRNKARLKNLLSRVRNNKKEIEIINRPNKFKLFDNEKNNNLKNIQRKYYEQIREEDKKNNNETIKDYFSTIIYELNQA